MSQTAVVITVSYLIAVAVGSAISLAVWRSTLSNQLDAGERGWHERETTWLLVVIVALVALLLGTIFFVPYGDSAGPGKQVVRVTGVQFAWAITPDSVRAGVPVEFLLTTRDVNHGYGIYDPDGVLLTQAQVVPGRTQRLVWTFETPGTYEVRCMEFCGVRHHEMNSSFEVAA